MNVPLQVRVPVNMVVGLRARLDRLVEFHTRDVERLSKRAATGNPEQIAAESRLLSDRAKRLTIHNLLRVTLSHGYEEVGKMKDADLINILADGIARGRPRRAA